MLMAKVSNFFKENLRKIQDLKKGLSWVVLLYVVSLCEKNRPYCVQKSLKNDLIRTVLFIQKRADFAIQILIFAVFIFEFATIDGFQNCKVVQITG